MNLSELRKHQTIFESNLVGTDGSLADKNSVKYSLERGVIGEGQEAIEALALHGVMSEEFRNEIVDMFVFFATILNHIGMTEAELEERTRRIVVKNFIKYHPRNFEGRTLNEGLSHSRSIWNKQEEPSLEMAAD